MTGLAGDAALACRLYILITLAAAVAGKLFGGAPLAETVAAITGLPERAARPAAAAVTAAEATILIGVAAAPGFGMAAALALFAVFWCVILAVVVRRQKVFCNCFGGSVRPISGLDLVRNFLLIAACACWLAVRPAAPADAAAWILLSGVAAIFFLVSSNLDELAAAAR